jgi:Crp-like helix-turn-helix domain
VGLFHPVGIRWLSLSAMTAARCLMVRRAPLLGFLARHPAAMQRMLEQLSMAAVQAAYSFSGVAFDDIGRRVASLILYIADQHGESTSDGLRIRLRLSQGELAGYVAASREGVNRALAALMARVWSVSAVATFMFTTGRRWARPLGPAATSISVDCDVQHCVGTHRAATIGA